MPAYAVIQPFTVMIEVTHASVASGTVFSKSKYMSVTYIAKVIVRFGVKGFELLFGNSFDYKVLYLISMLLIKSIFIDCAICWVAFCRDESQVKN